MFELGKSRIKVKVVKLPHGVDDLPSYQTPHASGVDLYAAITEPMSISPKSVALIPTGLSVAIPVGYELQIRPRSGLALKNAVTVLNSPGTIDADYRGEIQVVLMNFGEHAFTVTRGMRIAQGVLARVDHIKWDVVSELDNTARSSGGLGHTGV